MTPLELMIRCLDNGTLDGVVSPTALKKHIAKALGLPLIGEPSGETEDEE